MTITEAIITAGNNRNNVIGQRKTIDNICRRAIDIHAIKINVDDYDVIVILQTIEGHMDTVFLDFFLASPNC